MVRIEKEWVDKRTEGEKTTRLFDIFPGSNYRPNEVVKKDDFISPYIGKYYSNATEVLTMGLESIFEPNGGAPYKRKINGEYVYKKITDDLEYLNLILGLILKG